MKNDQEFEKSKVFIIVEIIEYVSNSVVIKTILKKQQGMSVPFLLIQAKRLLKKPLPLTLLSR
jgi:hypothetical protein